MVEAYAGVPHLKGDRSYNKVLAKLACSTQGTFRSSFGGFSSLFDIEKLKLRHPILVSTTDGVGTKLELARLLRKHDTIGIDLVAMCVNDLITCGAQPVIFLDYFAAGKFDRAKTIQVIKGIAEGCRQAGGGRDGARSPGRGDGGGDRRKRLFESWPTYGAFDSDLSLPWRLERSGRTVCPNQASRWKSKNYFDR